MDPYQAFIVILGNDDCLFHYQDILNIDVNILKNRTPPADCCNATYVSIKPNYTSAPIPVQPPNFTLNEKYIKSLSLQQLLIIAEKLYLNTFPSIKFCYLINLIKERISTINAINDDKKREMSLVSNPNFKVLLFLLVSYLSIIFVVIAK